MTPGPAPPSSIVIGIILSAGIWRSFWLIALATDVIDLLTGETLFLVTVAAITAACIDAKRE